MGENASMQVPTTKRAFTNRWCDTTANDLAISLIDKTLHDTTGRYIKETVRALPLNIRTSLSNHVFSHVDPETMRSLSQIDEKSKFLVDLSNVPTATLDRRNDTSETNTREQNYSVYGIPHTKNATPLSTYSSIINATGKSAYLRDTIAVRLNNDGTVALALTDSRVLLQRREERQAAQSYQQQTLSQDDFLRSLRDRVQQTVGNAYELSYRYSTPTAVSIPKTEQQQLERFRARLADSIDTGANDTRDVDATQDADHDDQDVVIVATSAASSELDLFASDRLAKVRAGTFRPNVTVTLHAPESLNPGTTFRGHILHSDRVTTAIVSGTDVYPIPTSALGTTMEVGTYATIVWRDEDHAQITADPARFSPDLGALARSAYPSVREIVAHERAALRMILAQNEHEHGSMRGMTAKELDGKTARLTLEVIGANEPHGYGLGRDESQRAIVLPFEQLGYRPNVGDSLTVDVVPHEHEGYRIRPIERTAQPTRDPINLNYEIAMENISRLNIAQIMNLEPMRILAYDPPANAHSVDAKVIFSSTDLTYFAAETADGPRIIAAPTFGHLETLGTFGDSDVGSRLSTQNYETGPGKQAFAEQNSIQANAKELVSMNALGELRNGYFDKLATMAIPPVPEVFAAYEAGAARLDFENGKLVKLEPREIEHGPIPHAIFAINGTVSHVVETQRMDTLARAIHDITGQGEADAVHFDAIVANVDDPQAIYLGAMTAGRIMITPLDRDLVNDPNEVLALYNDVSLNFDETTQRYTAALRGTDTTVQTTDRSRDTTDHVIDLERTA